MWAARSFVYLWQTVVVASRARSSSATGLPTISLCPTTTASAPRIVAPDDSSSAMAASAVHGASPSRP